MRSRIHGGAERQMALLSERISKAEGRVTIIDSTNGVMRELTKHNPAVEVVTPEKKLVIENSLVITQMSYAFCINDFLTMRGCEVRLWSMSSLPLPHMYLTSRLGILGGLFLKPLRRRYAEGLTNIRKSLFFQSLDSSNSISGFYNIELKSEPTLTLTDAKDYRNHESEEKERKSDVVWIGRLDTSSRIFAVSKLVIDFAEARGGSHEGELIIIGDGGALSQLKRLVVTLNMTRRVRFLGQVKLDELDRIVAGSEMLIAQGTSVYVGIKNKVPVLIVDFFFERSLSNHMRYRFFAETDDSTLGYAVTKKADLALVTGRSFDDVILSLKDEEFRKKVIADQYCKLKKIMKNEGQKIERLYRKPINPNDHLIPSFFLDKVFFRLRDIIIRSSKRQY